MALGTSRIFMSTDVGAPVVANNTPGAFISMLKAVLVNGYGSTQSLGWTVEYETATVAVFRMKGGTRYFLRFDDSIWNSVGHVDVSAYASMSSIDNGAERVPAAGITGAMQKRSQAAAINMFWIIIGDDAGFYLSLLSCDATNGALYFGRYHTNYFGDYCPFDVRNKWNFCMSLSCPGFPLSTGSIGYGFVPHAPNAGALFAYASRGSSFTKGSIYIGKTGLGSHYGHNTSVVSGSPLGASLNKLNGVFVTNPIRLYETISGSTVILGSFPGLGEPYMLDSSVTPTTALFSPILITDADGGKSILLFQNSSASYMYQVDKIVIKIGKGFRNVQ